ncbi:Uncharacterised protein [Mycobacteroides abscessus subsp. abscessus]|nr:Uncharacterised protein [Mycobacteroides abscessus subsp. abscessus]
MIRIGDVRGTQRALGGGPDQRGVTLRSEALLPLPTYRCVRATPPVQKFFGK